MRRWRLVLIADARSRQSGCTTGLREWIGNGFKVGPDYCKPPAPVAEDWIKYDDQEIENRHIVDWWTVFDDPKLNELIETAYRAEPDAARRGHARAAGAGPAGDRGRRHVSAVAAGIRAI